MGKGAGEKKVRMMSLFNYTALMDSARDEDRKTLERAEPAHQSGLDVVSESQIVASLGREHAGQIVSSFRCPSRRRMRVKESLIENIFLGCAGLDVHQ